MSAEDLLETLSLIIDNAWKKRKSERMVRATGSVTIDTTFTNNIPVQLTLSEGETKIFFVRGRDGYSRNECCAIDEAAGHQFTLRLTWSGDMITTLQVKKRRQLKMAGESSRAPARRSKAPSYSGSGAWY